MAADPDVELSYEVAPVLYSEAMAASVFLFWAEGVVRSMCELRVWGGSGAETNDIDKSLISGAPEYWVENEGPEGGMYGNDAEWAAEPEDA